jgi:hypothetical protein
MTTMGAWTVAGSALVALVTAFALRTRLPGAIVAVILTAAGAGIGWGGMVLQEDPTTPELIVGVVLMALLVPLHVRIVLGRFGPSARGRGIRAMADPTGPPGRG